MIARCVSEEQREGERDGEQDIKDVRKAKFTTRVFHGRAREREQQQQPGERDCMTDRTEQYEHLMPGRFIPA